VLRGVSACAVAVVLLIVPVAGVAAQQEPSADDGGHFSDQPSDVQALFVATWGQAAAQEWVAERNLQLAREAVPVPAVLNPTMPRPDLIILAPLTGQNVSTANEFTVRGTVTDPAAGPLAIDRVEVWLNGRRNTRGATNMGEAFLDRNGNWSLTISPTRFRAMNSNLYVYGHSTASGNTALGIVNFNIVDKK
jgi:Bacterial Ig domain